MKKGFSTTNLDKHIKEKYDLRTKEGKDLAYQEQKEWDSGREARREARSKEIDDECRRRNRPLKFFWAVIILGAAAGFFGVVWGWIIFVAGIVGLKIYSFLDPYNSHKYNAS
jgi:hypothetical protein